MADAFFALSDADRRDVLEVARECSGRPTHLLEKDVWVVWTLAALFDSPVADQLTFKGGTSLSKAYRIIERFSEDIDLTVDIRRLIPDLAGEGRELPASRSQADKWTRAVRDSLPGWVDAQVRPWLAQRLAESGIAAELHVAGKENEQLQLHYPALSGGTGYVAPVVTLEFGGRATGEPHQTMPIACDMDGHVEGVEFPTAAPQVMSVSRTFWEKATAAHVYCAQARLRGERFARHWHDLAAIARSTHFDQVVADRAVAQTVADHKSCFFAEKDATGSWIDYGLATRGGLQIVPAGAAREVLAADYAAMVADEVMLGSAVPFDALMRACEDLQDRANQV
ncbi:nucleotidyl transferase AbiEii/AbiGii toxin family protein [Leptothrix sp. BB-4]